MSFFEKLNEKLFGNVSGKVEVLTKILTFVVAIFGLIFLVAGIVQVITYGSFGFGDEDVTIGIKYIVLGLFMVVGGYWIGLLALGFNKMIERAEFDLFLEEETFEMYDDPCCDCEKEECGDCEHQFEVEITEAEDKTEK